jgi:uncharacterized protein YfaS (alpha-2-macroglobulin family)
VAAKKRGDFKDTAYWTASLITNDQGRGEVTFTLPDNLTTWQIETLGVTLDTKLGVGYSEFTTKKDLMLVPQKPRFIVPGDTFALGAHIFNQSGRDETVTVTLESPTLTFLEDTTRTVSVKQGESELVYVRVSAPTTVKEGRHQFTFTAKTSAGRDQVELDIPITKNTVYETVATANFTKATTSTEYLFVPENVVMDQGELTINANATLAVFMSDALRYMAQYPYGCSEQIASALSTIAMITRAQTVPGVEGELPTVRDMYGVEHTVAEVVEEGLTRIYETQLPDGGFSYYKGLESDLYLTQRIALALHELRRAGYDIRADVINRAVTFVETQALQDYSESPDRSFTTIILSTYVVHTVGNRTSATLDPVVSKLIDERGFLSERISSTALGYLTLLTERGGFSAARTERVYEALTNRIDIDGRGAYLKNPRDGSYGYFETSVGNTALLLQAFTAREDQHPMLGNVLRWLLASRDRDGVWGSTQNTFMVVSALVDYLSWQHETEARFSLTGRLGDTELFSHTFGQSAGISNVFETFTRVVPMSMLPQNTLTPLTFTRTDEPGAPRTNLYYDLALRYYLPAAQVSSRDEGITIERNLFALTDAKDSSPLRSATVGEVVKGKIRLTIPESYAQVAVEDIIPAGFELVNFTLATESDTLLPDHGGESGGFGLGDIQLEGAPQYQPLVRAAELSLWERVATRVTAFFTETPQVAQVPYDYFDAAGSDRSFERARTRTLYPTHSELHDDRVFLYLERLDPGVYEYEYYLRALIPGEFTYLPAQASQLYFPEVFGRTSGNTFTISEPR